MSTDNLELNLDLAVQNNPYIVVALRDFNVKLKYWYEHDQTSFKEPTMENIFSQFGLHQILINQLMYQILTLNVLT